MRIAAALFALLLAGVAHAQQLTGGSGGGSVTSVVCPSATITTTGNCRPLTTTGTSGDVVTATGTANGVQDSGTLLSGLAPLAGPALTGTPSAPSVTVNGTGGLGFIDFGAQSADPVAPASTHFRIFGNSTGQFSWSRSDGFARTFTLGTLTADRTITFPTDQSISVARIDAAQTVAGIQTFSSSPIVSSLTATSNVCVDGSSALTSTCSSATPSFGATTVANLTDSGVAASQPVCTNGSKVLTTGTTCGLSAAVFSYPGSNNPPSFTNTLTPQMLGLASANCTAPSAGSACFATVPVITPATTGRVMINITGSFQHGVSSQTTTYQLIYGAGTPPVNAASVTGTSVGNAQTITALVGGQPNSFELPSIVTGLTLGTAYWFDLSVKESAGTTIPTQFTVTLQEF